MIVQRDVALEAAIAANPDDAAAYAVYADWLLERGDLRGELINVQLQRERDPADEALAAREQALLAAQTAAWLSHLVDAPWLDRPIEVTWRRGFVDTAVIESSYDSDEAALAYRSLAETPVAMALRTLAIGVACTHHGKGPADTSVLEALRDLPPANLRALALTAFHQVSWTHVGELAIATPALPRLERLEIVAGRMALGAIDLPQLRTLRLETGGLEAHVLHDLAAAAWPRLAILELFLGTENYGGTCTLADTRPILDGARFPAVRSLALCNGTFADELAAALATAPILRQLTHLDLSKGTMGEEGARAILRHADAFAHLDVLDLRENYLPEAVRADLAKICKTVELADQKTEDEWGRFVTLGEG